MKISPTILFWVSLITTVGQGVTAGAVHLTHIVPDSYIPTVTSWIGLVVFINMSFLTAMAGLAGPGSGPLARAPTVPEAQKVMEQAKAAEGK